MLNHGSPVPLYRQLADIILSKIRSGEYASESRILSEHKLAEKYKIGRPTVRQATDLLIRKRILSRKRGSGTFVKPKEKEIDLFSFAGTIFSFKQQGIIVKTKILEKMKLTKVSGDHENPFFDGKAYFFSRLSLADNKPILIEDFYFHPDLFFNIDQIEISGRSISRIAEEHFYMRPRNGRQNFRVSYLKGKRAMNLDVSPDIPILLVKRFLNFKQAENAVFSKLYCRTDRFIFSQTIGGISDD